MNRLKKIFTAGVKASKDNEVLLKENFKRGGLKGGFKTLFALSAMNTVAFAADDEVFQPLVDLLLVWLQGNLGYVIALFVVAAGIVYGALGGGAPHAFKAVFFGLLIGAISFVAEKAFNIGLSFS